MWKNLYRSVVSWIKKLFGKKKPLPYKTIRAEELPEMLYANSIYLIGEGDHLWYVALLCPCGCEQTILLNASKNSVPQWIVTELDSGVVSLQPSVWRTKGCKSHFFFNQGFIDWV